MRIWVRKVAFLQTDLQKLHWKCKSLIIDEWNAKETGPVFEIWVFRCLYIIYMYLFSFGEPFLSRGRVLWWVSKRLTASTFKKLIEINVLIMTQLRDDRQVETFKTRFKRNTVLYESSTRAHLLSKYEKLKLPSFRHLHPPPPPQKKNALLLLKFTTTAIFAQGNIYVAMIAHYYICLLISLLLMYFKLFFLSIMLSLDVPSKMRWRNKSLVTELALKWLFSGVCPFVRLKSSILGKTFGTIPKWMEREWNQGGKGNKGMNKSNWSWFDLTCFKCRTLFPQGNAFICMLECILFEIKFTHISKGCLSSL